MPQMPIRFCCTQSVHSLYSTGIESSMHQVVAFDCYMHHFAGLQVNVANPYLIKTA